MHHLLTKIIPFLTILGVLVGFPLPSFAEGVGGAISTGIEQVLWMFVAGVFGTLTGLAGMLMNAGINTFVVEFGSQYRDGGLGFVIDSLWVVVRDIFNLFFIFGLVYIGFKMILRSDDSNTRRWLISLILAALLVNFSLFITKAVIDFSNLMATQIVQNGFGVDAFARDGDYDYNVSGAFLGQMNLTTVFNIAEGGSIPNFAQSSNGAGFGYIFGTAIVLIIAAFVFAAGGIMLMIRFVALNFFMLLSPFMFIGWVFPPLQRYTSMYWQGFLGRAFFAPVYVLLIYFAFRVMTGYRELTGLGKMGEIFGGGDAVARSFSSTLVPFLLTGFFLLAAIIAAQKMSADGASATMRIGNNITNRGRQALQRGAAGASRSIAANTGGRLARAGSEVAGNRVRRGLNSLQSFNAPATGGGARGWAARRVQNTARSNAVERTIGGAAAGMQNAKFGMSTTRQQDRASASATASTADNRAARERGAALTEEERNYQEWDRRRKALEEENKVNATNKVLLADGTVKDTPMLLTADENAALTQKTAEAKVRQDILAKTQLAANNLSTKDLEQMSQKEREEIAEFLSSSQTEALMKSDNINSADKGKIAIKRQAALKAMVEEGGKVLTEQFQKLSTAQLETLGLEYLDTNAEFLSDKQIEDLAKSKNVTETQISTLRGRREEKLTATFGAGASATTYSGTRVNGAFYNNTIQVNPGGGQGTIVAGKAKRASEIAKLSAKILTKPDAAAYITADVLKEVVKDKKLGFTDMQEVGKNAINYIEDIYTTNPPGSDKRKQADALHKYLGVQRNADEFGVNPADLP